MARNQKEKLKKVIGGEKKSFIWSMPPRWNNYSPERLKLIFITLLLFGAIITLFPFLSTTFFRFSADHVIAACQATTTTTTTTSSAVSTTLTPTAPQQPHDQVLESGIIRRSFYPVGTAAYNFVLMSAYRGGPHTFAVMGLSSKPLHTYGHPTYKCEYQSYGSSNNTSNSKMVVPGEKLSFQDFGYARVYLVIVVNCTFPGMHMDPSSGGRLLLHASTNGGYDRIVHSTDTIVALDEPPHSWDPSQYSSPPKYNYLYCGSSLFGGLSPQRVREWIAYHVKFFGKPSHFVIHDAGGVHPEVFEVLKPWIELGYVTVEDIKEQERFDAFYHNQMLVINDCLHRHRFSTKWMFFFDLDEFLYLPDQSTTLESVMDQVNDYTLFVIEQVSMSNRLCLSQDAPKISKKWGFEKLVYKNAKKMRRDFKYAIQPRNVFATGVHMSENLVGKTTRLSDKLIKYYHFHGTVAERREPCRQLLNNESSIKLDNIPYVLDTTLRSMASSVKKFELDTIGSRLQSTKL